MEGFGCIKGGLAFGRLPGCLVASIDWRWIMVNDCGVRFCTWLRKLIRKEREICMMMGRFLKIRQG